MTRDERAVISILNAYKKGYESAMEDYKQQPCEDAISREAALNTINAMRVACDTNDIADYYILLLEAFKQLPPVTPKQKSGHWEWVQYDSSPNIGNWRCSECRAIIPHTPKETDNTPIYKLCPMCGAKMVEPQESEEISDRNMKMWEEIFKAEMESKEE